MAFDHISVTVATTPTLIYTVPKGATQAYITIQNRDTTANINIGDSSLSTIGTPDGGVKIPAATGNLATTPASVLQFWANGGDAIYAIASTTPALTNYCVVLASYVNTLGS
jgi:hypothetical protein